MSIMAGSRQALGLSSRPRAHILIHNTRQRTLTRNSMGFWNLKVTPSDTPPSTRPRLLILPQKFQQLGTSFRFLSPWGGVDIPLQATTYAMVLIKDMMQKGDIMISYALVLRHNCQRNVICLLKKVWIQSFKKSNLQWNLLWIEWILNVSLLG